MSKILVTGGAGFIGSHTCLRLLENGHKIVVIDSFLNSSRKSLLRVNKLITENKIEIFEGDLKIQENIEHVFLKSKYDDNKTIIKLFVVGFIYATIITGILYYLIKFIAS